MRKSILLPASKFEKEAQNEPKNRVKPNPLTVSYLGTEFYLPMDVGEFFEKVFLSADSSLSYIGFGSFLGELILYRSNVETEKRSGVLHDSPF